MRTCSNCGAQFPDDELICPVCGQEVQLVPDYETIETHNREEQLRKEEERKKQAEELEKKRAVDTRKKQIRRNILLSVCLAAAACAVIVILVISIRNSRNESSFDYQYSQAVSAYDGGDYDTALEYVQKALALDSDNPDALFLLCEIYEGRKDTVNEEKALEELVGIDPENEKAFDMLIGLYSSAGEDGKIIALLKSTDNMAILTKYSDYIAKRPAVSPNGGTYSKDVTVEISSESDGTIYYSVDGSKPGKNSLVYTDPFKLSEGTTEVKAVLITDSGISSKVTEADFTIAYDVPDAPVISPASGTYEKDADEAASSSGTGSDSYSESSSGSEDEYRITVVVPKGYTCYYSFDKRPDESSSRYTGPVQMREGEHIFYAVLQDNETGKLGRISSATYIYSVATPTPTPTAAPEQKAWNSANMSASGTRNAENVATPTPTETPAPTPTETPTPAPDEIQAPSSDETSDGVSSGGAETSE